MTDEIRAKIDEINRTKTEDEPIVCEEKAVWMYDRRNEEYYCSNCGWRSNYVGESKNCFSCGKPMRMMDIGDDEEKKYHV